MPDATISQSDFDAVRAQLADLTGKVGRLSASASSGNAAQETDSATSAPVGASPFYEVTIATSLTLTAGIGDDWDPRFDDLSVATDRVKFAKATVGGELQFQHIGTYTGKRFKIAWESDAPQQILAHLSGYPAFTGAAGAGDVQIKFNGRIEEYDFSSPASYYLQLDGIAGRNILVICFQYGPFYPIFDARCFDGKKARWVDPTDLTGYVKE